MKLGIGIVYLAWFALVFAMCYFFSPWFILLVLLTPRYSDQDKNFGGDIINASDKAFVIKVRKRMIDLGINQRILAEKIGISPAYISQIFTGERDLTIDIQRRIIDELWQKEPNETGKR